MRVIIAGSRDINDIDLLVSCIEESGLDVSRVISGCAPGMDQLGITWALCNNVPVDRFPADWNKHGKAAGPIRNQEMADNADALIAIRKDNSRGTTDMINRARSKGLKVFVKDI
jgi:hypothetical protein